MRERAAASAKRPEFRDYVIISLSLANFTRPARREFAISPGFPGSGFREKPYSRLLAGKCVSRAVTNRIRPATQFATLHLIASLFPAGISHTRVQLASQRFPRERFAR